MRLFPWKKTGQYIFFGVYLAGISTALCAMMMRDDGGVLYQARENLKLAAGAIAVTEEERRGARRFSFLDPRLSFQRKAAAVPAGPEFQELLTEILPPFTNDPVRESFDVGGKTIYPAYREKIQYLRGGVVARRYETEGFAYRARDPEEELVEVLIALDMAGRIHGVRFLSYQGMLGFTEVLEGRELYFEAFRNKMPDEIRSREEGGEISLITEAPLLSQRVIEAVREGGLFFMTARDSFIDGMVSVLLQRYREHDLFEEGLLPGKVEPEERRGNESF